MEGIIIIAILYFIFKSIAQKGKANWNMAKERSSTGGAVQTSDVQQKAPKTRNAQPQRKAATQSTPTQMNAAVEHRTIAPTVKVDSQLSAYATNIGANPLTSRVSPEGRASNEGTGSSEGTPYMQNFISTEGSAASELSLEQSRDHMQSAYTIDTADNDALQVLPNHWSGNDIVRAVVMSEILKRPQGRSDYRG